MNAKRAAFAVALACLALAAPARTEAQPARAPASASTAPSTPAPAPATAAPVAPTTDAAPAAPQSGLPTQAERERFHRLAGELRCLVCQNQTLADSDADLAADLRREVEQLMLAGRSDEAIKAYLVERYGDFVLYRPPMQRNTWLLWLGPFGLLVVGALAWWRVQRSHDSSRPATTESGSSGTPDRKGSGAGSAPPPGASLTSDADLERARRLLD